MLLLRKHVGSKFGAYDYHLQCLSRKVLEKEQQFSVW